MRVPWNASTVQLKVTKHFALKYLRAWGWDFHDLRDAIIEAYKVDAVGKNKFEIYVQKSGFKKIITVYYSAEDELLCITGSQGGERQ